MNKTAILHIPKSQYSFAYGKRELRLRLRTAKNDIESAEVIYAVKYAWLTDRKRRRMSKSFSDALYDYYTVSLEVADTRIGYVFFLRSGEESYYYSEEGLTREYDHEKSYYNFFQFPYINAIDVHAKVDWCDRAVFYQIFVERFAMGSGKKYTAYIDKKWEESPTPTGFHGGDLAGITEKLGYLEDLGINGIYLTPVFESPSNHKYDTVNYYRVDDMFGSNDDLKKLVETAHNKGIRIVLDAVLNHCSYLSRQFQDVLKYGKDSRYYDWFLIRGGNPDLAAKNYECFASCYYMPKWNTGNPEVQDFLLEVAVTWIRDYGIDGWRLDVADEVSHDFWRRFRKAVKAVKLEALIIGENWHDARPWLGGDQFDSIMNYSFTKACLDFFAFAKYGAERFCERLSELLMRNTDQVNGMMLNLLDSHDTERFLTMAGGNTDKLKCALAVQFFYAGVPCVYYGTEIGMRGGYEPDSRRAFPWNPAEWDAELFETVKALIALKKTKINGGIRMFAREGIVFIERESVTLAVNNSAEEKRCAFGARTYTLRPFGYEIIDGEGKPWES